MYIPDLTGYWLTSLLVLVMTLGPEVGGHPCQQGQVAHSDWDGGKLLRCCLPVDCDPDHYVKYCKINGTRDTCEKCPRAYRLFKRTSSFAVESCHQFPLNDKCENSPGSIKATEEDTKRCYCKLEDGEYYMKPEVMIGSLSMCQISNLCNAGFQNTLDGKCEKCPRNTFQSVDEAHWLCRPQRNCTAMGLKVLQPGTSKVETICTKPEPAPSTPYPPSSGQATTLGKSTSTTLLPIPVPGDTDEPSVRPSLNGGVGSEQFPNMILIIIIVCCLVFVLLSMVMVVVCGRKHGWFSRLRKCHQRDPESHTYPGTQIPMSGDSDNTSDNSGCAATCADICKTSSKGSGNSAKSGAGPSNPTKNQGLGLDAYVNMNGKGKVSPSDSEPIYNSIAHDPGKLSDGTYKNVNGIPPTFLRQDDFYTNYYPTKVNLPSSNDEEDDDDSLKKGCGPYQPVKNHGDDFKETDPLLPSSDGMSSGVPTPVDTPGLRGILRKGGRGGRGGGGRGGSTSTTGNRPHLSLLLNAPSDASYIPPDPAHAENLPHLSQLVSAQSAASAANSAQPPEQQQPEEQQVHELPAQLQNLLLQQQEGSTFPARAVQTVPGKSAAPPPTLNPTLVQMEELKPVMPLTPSPATTPAPTPDPPPPLPQGAANLPDRTGSPARIDPSQQEEVKAKANPKRSSSNPPPVPAPKPVYRGAASAGGPGPGSDADDQTFRKQPPGQEDEESAQKSVGGSSGLGDSIELSSPLSMPPSSTEEGRRSRTPYRRSVSEVSRSVSPTQPLPPSRSISSPEEKQRPFAVVKPMQSDQSLNLMSCSPDRLAEPLDSAGRHFPLHSLGIQATRRQVSQDSSDDPDQTRPKTPDRLSEDESEEPDNETNGTRADDSDRTRTSFHGDDDSDPTEGEGKDKNSNQGSEG